MSFQELFQSADWKKEKHSPVIEIIAAKKGQPVTIQVSIGKEIPHPNTTEHHINWIDVYFQPSGEKFAVQLGKFEFTAHGASITGANSSTIYSEPNVTLLFKTDKSGVLYASSYCNIHGLWASEQELKLA
ncbi:MAG TPA: class II SORL domain-containing protein [bacterium]|nr:class II SORL domain-containing protein [bacterium]HPN45791.1 class II SORL domain-containing protein [bacterium]